MSNREGYFVFFKPGSRGRLFGNIIYKLINSIQSNFPISQYNSAHLYIDEIKLDFAMKSYNDVRTFATSTSIDDEVPVVVSHLYPEEGIEEFSKTTKKGIILINIKKKNIPEIHLNAAIKNIFPILRQKIDNVTITEKDAKLVEMYYNQYLKITNRELDTRVLTDKETMKAFLKFLTSDYYVEKHSLYWKQFIDNPISESDQVFRIEYDELSNKNEIGQYTTLLKLSDWLGVEYNDDVHKIYTEYEEGQIKLFEKYCPWFLTGDENEPR